MEDKKLLDSRLIKKDQLLVEPLKDALIVLRRNELRTKINNIKVKNYAIDRSQPVFECLAKDIFLNAK